MLVEEVRQVKPLRRSHPDGHEGLVIVPAIADGVSVAATSMRRAMNVPDCMSISRGHPMMPSAPPLAAWGHVAGRSGGFGMPSSTIAGTRFAGRRRAGSAMAHSKG